MNGGTGILLGCRAIAQRCNAKKWTERRTAVYFGEKGCKKLWLDNQPLGVARSKAKDRDSQPDVLSLKCKLFRNQYVALPSGEQGCKDHRGSYVHACRKQASSVWQQQPWTSFLKNISFIKKNFNPNPLKGHILFFIQ